jgi:hypothetical protein
MREFFTVDYEYRPESDSPYTAIIKLWIKANQEGLLPKCYVNSRVTLFGEKLYPNWGAQMTWENDTYRVGEVTLTSDLDWEVVQVRVENFLRVSTYILSKVTKKNLNKERATPGSFTREIFEANEPYDPYESY